MEVAQKSIIKFDPNRYKIANLRKRITVGDGYSWNISQNLC